MRRVGVADGRAVAVQAFGDPNGPPVIYCHGWPACRLEAGLIPGLEVRLIALDRPGYGGSDAQPGRRLCDWPCDVAAVADALGLGRFHLIGVSGGGPFAAAVARALPERVRGLALVNAVPPPTTPGLAGSGVAALFQLGRRPQRAGRMLSAARALLRFRLLTPGRIIGSGLPEADRACLTRPTLAAIGRVWREALAPGVAGALSDATILAAPWCVDLGDIRVPTTVWAGAADSMVPARAATAYAAIPGAAVRVVADEGHYSLPLLHANRILRALVGGGDERSSPSPDAATCLT